MAKKRDIENLFKLIKRDIQKDLEEVILKDIMTKEARSFRRTVESWKTKPSFLVIKSGNSYGIYTDSEVYHWIDKGTSPHIITATNSRTLAIPKSRFYSTDYYSKSYSPQRGERPNLTSKNRYDDSYGKVFPKTVLHSGITPRRWSELIAESFPSRLEKSLRKYGYK